MTFFDDLAAAKTADVPSEDVSVLLNGHAHTLRFRQMNGYEWQNEVDNNPVRPGVAVDQTTGYNIRALVQAVAPKSGVLVEGDNETELEPEQWEATLRALNGRDFGQVSDAIWRLNDAIPARTLADAMEKAKKARSRTSKATD